jgi:hypothetical protein
MVGLAITFANRVILDGAGLTIGIGLTVSVVQVLIALVLVSPLWRKFWKWWPQLNNWIYPDLNGEWDVELTSNWPRIDALLKTANGELPQLDFRQGNPSLLPAMGSYKMKAEITQSWSTFEIQLWNPGQIGPIKESRTLLVEPFRKNEGRRHGLAYIFEQRNDTEEIGDNDAFCGAAWIELDRNDPKVLCGKMWTNRMWERGMNTAAKLTFRRAMKKK